MLYRGIGAPNLGRPMLESISRRNCSCFISSQSTEWKIFGVDVDAPQASSRIFVRFSSRLFSNHHAGLFMLNFLYF